MDWILQRNYSEKILDKIVPYLEFNFVKPSNQKNAIDAAISYIKKICQSYPPPYTLMCSGGVDSQAMLWAWHLSGQTFTCLNVKYIHENIWFNEHDVHTLTEFTRQYNIPLIFKNIDPFPFWNSNDYFDLAFKYKCCSPQICLHMKMIDDVPGTKIFSGNFLGPPEIHQIDYTILGLHRYSIDNPNQNLIPFFFLGDQHLAFAFYDSKSKMLETKKESYIQRVLTYQDCGFPVIPQIRKLTGFEKIKEYYDVHFLDKVTTEDRLFSSKQPSKRVFDMLLRYRILVKIEEHIPHLRCIISN